MGRKTTKIFATGEKPNACNWRVSEFKLQLAVKQRFEDIQTQSMNAVNIFEFLDVIRKRPGFYIGNEKSLKMLRSFLTGFECGLSHAGYRESPFGQLFRDFNNGVAVQLGFGETAMGWCDMIVSKTGSDEKAYDLFFELLDKYRRGHGLMS